MPFDQSSHSCRRPAHAATLPTRQLPRFTISQLMSAVREILTGRQTQIDLDLALTADSESYAFPRFWGRPKTPPTIGLTIGGVTVAVTGHDRSAFDAEDLVRLDVDGWPGGRSEIARCSGHVEVSEVRASASREANSGFERAAAVTLVAAAVSNLVDTIGLVWHASLASLPKDRLPGIVEGLLACRAPTALWLCARPLAERDGQPVGLMTRGLYPLLGAEIRIDEVVLPRSVALEIIVGLGSSIVGAGSLPVQDARLNFGAGHAYRVRHAPQDADNDVPSIVLIPETELLVAGAA